MESIHLTDGPPFSDEFWKLKILRHMQIQPFCVENPNLTDGSPFSDEFWKLKIL